MYFNDLFSEMQAVDVVPLVEDAEEAREVKEEGVQEEGAQEEGDEDDEHAEGDSANHENAPGGKRRKKELHRRHSKRYRDNLGELFHSLEVLLPNVVPGCKLKTKSQIIANSVHAVKRLKAEVSALEMQYVLSSPANRTKWVEETVRNAATFQEVVEPFMRLLLGMQRWKHSELWVRHELPQPLQVPLTEANPEASLPGGGFCLRLELIASGNDVATTSLPATYKQFFQISQTMTFEAGDDSLVGRIATSLSPEWINLTDSNSLNGFKRGELARSCGFSVCFAVPFLVRGHVLATVLFYDDQQRTDISGNISIAQDLASCLGNCYGAYGALSQQQGR